MVFKTTLRRGVITTRAPSCVCVCLFGTLDNEAKVCMNYGLYGVIGLQCVSALRFRGRNFNNNGWRFLQLIDELRPAIPDEPLPDFLFILICHVVSIIFLSLILCYMLHCRCFCWCIILFEIWLFINCMFFVETLNCHHR